MGQIKWETRAIVCRRTKKSKQKFKQCGNAINKFGDFPVQHWVNHRCDYLALSTFFFKRLANITLGYVPLNALVEKNQSQTKPDFFYFIFLLCLLSLIPKMDDTAVTCMNQRRLLTSSAETRGLPKECIYQNLTHIFISLNTTLLHSLNSCYINACPAFQWNSNNSWNQVKQQEKLASSLEAGMAQQSGFPLLFHFFHTPLSLVPCFIFISAPSHRFSFHPAFSLWGASAWHRQSLSPRAAAQRLDSPVWCISAEPQPASHRALINVHVQTKQP